MVASARASTARNLRTVDAISDSAAAKRTSAERIFRRLTVGLGANGTAATMLAAVKPASKYERAVRYTIILRRGWNMRQVGGVDGVSPAPSAVALEVVPLTMNACRSPQPRTCSGVSSLLIPWERF